MLRGNTALDVLVPVLEITLLALEVAIVCAWIYAYEKTKLKGLAVIVLAYILMIIEKITFPLLVSLSPINIPKLRVVFSVINIIPLIILLCGIIILIKELTKFLPPS